MSPYLWALVCAMIVVRTAAQSTIVDDTDMSQLLFSPPGLWTSTCTTCQILPDASKANGASWKDASYDPTDTSQELTMAFQFQGSSLDVFCILVNSIPGFTTTTNLSFTLDGTVYPNFIHLPTSNAETYEYNSSVFSVQGLTNIPHSFKMTVTGGERRSFVIFDYLRYGTGASSTSPSSSASARVTLSTASSTAAAVATPASSTPIGGIVGGIVAGIAVIVITVLLLLYLRRRRRKRQIPEPFAVQDKGDLESFRGVPQFGNNSQSNVTVLRGKPALEASQRGYGVNNYSTTHTVATSPSNDGSHFSTFPVNTTRSMHTTTSPVTTEHSPTTGPRVLSEKAALREAEINSEIRRRENMVQQLEAQRGSSYHPVGISTTIRGLNRSGTTVTAVTDSSQSMYSGRSTNDEQLQNEIHTLREEMQSMRAQQQQMMLELNAAPPPQYRPTSAA